MSIDPIDPKIAADAALAFSGQNEVKELEALSRGGAKNIEEISTRFESIFLNFLIKQMWESVERSGLLPDGPGKQIYDGFFTTMLSDFLAENGGIGIAKNMTAQLKNAADAYERQNAEAGADKTCNKEPLDANNIAPADNEKTSID